jgi:hypothetical protein
MISGHYKYIFSWDGYIEYCANPFKELGSTLELVFNAFPIAFAQLTKHKVTSEKDKVGLQAMVFLHSPEIARQC